MRVLLAISTLTALAMADNLSNLDLSGSVRMGAWSDMTMMTDDAGSRTFSPSNFVNEDFRLNAKLKLDDGIRVIAGLRTFSTDSNGNYSSPDFGRGAINNKFGQNFLLDQYALEWEFKRDMSFGIGRYVYSSGALPNEQLYSDAVTAATVTREQRDYAFSFLAQDFKAYLGIPADKAQGITFFAEGQYELLKESQRRLLIKPTVEFNIWDRSRDPWTVASQADWSQRLNADWRYFVHGSAAAYGYPGSGPISYGLFAQPSLDWKSLATISFSAWYAYLVHEDSTGLRSLPMPVQQYFKLETSVPFLSCLSFDLPVSWNRPMLSDDHYDFWLLTPGFSFFPSGQAEFRIWGGYRFGGTTWGGFADGHDRPVFGFDTKLNF